MCVILTFIYNPVAANAGLAKEEPSSHGLKKKFFWVVYSQLLQKTLQEIEPPQDVG